MIHDQHWRWVARGALLLYCLWSLLLIAQKPGLQYDEALLTVSAVHMRNSPAELSLPHDPRTWVCVLGRCYPLMMVRYAGAVKDYLCLPLFAVFGPCPGIIRIVSMLLGMIGIWGIARLVTTQAGEAAGAIAALAIAISPAYVNMTVFDNGTVGVWMGAVGILCLTLSRYIQHGAARTAFWVGVAMGLGVWARANFIWLLAALFVAALLVLRKKLLAPAPHWAALTAGGIVGGFPFLVYEVHSRGGTWEALDMFAAAGSLGDLLFNRFVMFSETLLTDREHRAMWNGPPMADWQRLLFPGIVLAACLVCLAMNSRYRIFARIATLTLLVFGVLLLTSRLQVSEHHLIALVPVATVIVVLACEFLLSRYKWGWTVAAAVAILYLACALTWQVASIQGLRQTGGAGPWSDGIYELNRRLPKQSVQRIKILDWGLQDNLYVLSDGKIHSREIFEDGSHGPWIDEIRNGGIFVLNGPANRQFPAASEAFLRTLEDARPIVRRYTVTQRSGVPFAEVIEIEPNTIQQSPPVSRQRLTLSTGDSQVADRLEGFHQIENGWRWTKRNFAITFDLQQAADLPQSLTLQLYLPDSIIQKLGAMTLTARVGNHQLAPETYARPGQYVFQRDLQPGWLKPGPNRFEFALDKSLPPTPADDRELGVVVLSASMR